MQKLPDLEGLALFAKVAEARGFARAAEELGLSKATVSKAVARLEARLGALLFNRTSRRLALTEAGARLLERASRIVAEAELAECEAQDEAARPRGRVRLAAPMSFGMLHLAAALPDFTAAYPEVSVDLDLSDSVVDLIGGGFDLALRIAALPDSSLRARRLAPVELLVVGAPDYFARRGRPAHPAELAEHDCLVYANGPGQPTWRFVNPAGEEASLRPAGPLRANNGDVFGATLRSGAGIALQPDFICWDDVAAGRLEVVLSGWRATPPIALHLVSPPAGPRPARVQALADFLATRFSRAVWKGD